MWTIDTEFGTVALSEHKLQELLTLVDIPAMQCRIWQKDLECLVGKLHSMHLVVIGAVTHLYQIQRALAQGEGRPSLAVAVIPL